jgi:hypothetical protein
MVTGCLRLKPFVIGDWKTAENELRLYDYDKLNVFVTSRSNSFITGKLFELWAERMFDREQFHDKGRILLLLDSTFRGMLRYHCIEKVSAGRLGRVIKGVI